MTSLSLIFLVAFSVVGLADDYANDDAHNHDGTHVEGQENCGTNYLQPGEVARLGSHSFLILGEDGPEHLLLDHRSGTPPHTYQFILKVRADKNEMATYRKLLKESKVALPAVTTIYFDKDRVQKDRTFFCLQDLKTIFGPEQKSNDRYAKLFPIRASWQKNADFEGVFPIQETVVPEEPMVIDRKDVEIVVYRYLPSYLEQSSFRKLLKEKGSAFTSVLSDSPVRQDEAVATARQRRSYVNSGAFDSNGETCPSDYYLKMVRPPKTKHAFLLLADIGKNRVLASHLYDQSPQNYQTTLHFTLSDEQMKMFRELQKTSKTPLLFMPEQFFCMSDIKNLVKGGSLKLTGPVLQNTEYEDFKLGQSGGDLTLSAKAVQVLVSRTLQSLMNPQAVARDVFGFVDIQKVDPSILVDAAYFTDWNFIGKPINGYNANRCYLTEKAAKALSAVQREVAKQGYGLLVFDCYRPQRAVDEFVAWTKNPADAKMKTAFYPDEPKNELVQRGYIDSKSGHSRGSTVDLTLMRLNAKKAKTVQIADCRSSKDIEQTGQLDMGTTYDCFSELANTASPNVPADLRKNRELLKAAMEQQGFKNYPKEWWHYTLKEEPYKNDYFDFEVQ